MESGTIKISDVRWMTRGDLPAVLDIDSCSFDRPWSEEEYCNELRNRDIIGMVIPAGDKIAGFMLYKLERSRIMVLRFGVHPNSRRQGFGRKMVEKLKAKLKDNRRTRLELFARETELDALHFFKKMGFRATDLIRDHFTDSGVDAIRMMYQMEDMICENTKQMARPVNRMIPYFEEQL